MYMKCTIRTTAQQFQRMNPALTPSTVFQKLQTLPMYNYPNFLNLLTTFMYIPLSFLYILPVAKFNLLNGTISPEQLSLPKTLHLPPTTTLLKHSQSSKTPSLSSKLPSSSSASGSIISSTFVA